VVAIAFEGGSGKVTCPQSVCEQVSYLESMLIRIPQN
jgi:hypothetical protein